MLTSFLWVNFRGSVGFGKRHTNAGNGEWGRKMHHDLLDAVDFAVRKGIADRNRTAIMGIVFFWLRLYHYGLRW